MSAQAEVILEFKDTHGWDVEIAIKGPLAKMCTKCKKFNSPLNKSCTRLKRGIVCNGILVEWKKSKRAKMKVA